MVISKKSVLIRFFHVTAWVLSGIFFSHAAVGADLSVRIGWVQGGVTVTSGTNGNASPGLKDKSLHPGQTLLTENAGSVELVYADLCIMRLGPMSKLSLFSESHAANSRAVLISGNVWVNAAARKKNAVMGVATPNCRLETATGVFRLTVHPDQTVEAKAYKGAIEISGPPETNLLEKSKETPLSDAPLPAVGKWNYDLSPHTKIVVWPTGNMTKPFRFSAKADQNRWVRWNMDRDTAKGLSHMAKEK